MEPTIERRQFKQRSRRELLKLSPVLLAGAFAIPSLRKRLLGRGIAFSDWASGELFQREHTAATFPDSALTPIERFPYNTYDDDDPGVDLEAWTLTVSGLVKKPGEYTLDQIRSLPKITQNTRHVCVEGWDVIGSFGGVRISDFLASVGADAAETADHRSEEHTSELQSPCNLVCRLLLEKKKKKTKHTIHGHPKSTDTEAT